MARPNFVTELDIGGDPSDNSWANVVDISSDVRSIEIERGAPDELSPVEAATIDLELDNREGRFDSDNPASDLYPYLQPEGMKLRVYVPRYGAKKASSTVTLSGNEQTDALRRDGRPYRFPIASPVAGMVAETTLSGAMTNVQTTLPITKWPVNRDGSSIWPMFSAFRLMIDRETVLVTGGWGTTTLTVTRGVAQRWGSAQAAAAHSAGAVVSNFFDNWTVVNSKAYSLGGIPSNQVEVVPDGFGRDQKALRVIVHPGDQNDATDPTRERLEFTRQTLGELGERWFYAFSRKLEPGFHANNSGVGATTMQLGPNNNQGSPSLVFRVNFNEAGGHKIGPDYFRLVFNTGVDPVGFTGTYTQQFDLVYAEEGVRHDFIFDVFWHLSAGTIRVYHRIEDGPWAKVLELTGIPTSTDFGGLGTPSVKLSAGIYRNADATLTNSILIGNHRVGASIWDVLPDEEPLEDGSVGIWPATTNLLSNETLTASGTPVILNPDPAVEPPIPGSNVQRVDFLALNDYVHRTFSGLTIGTTYTLSWWVLREEDDAQFITVAVRNAANSANVVSANAAAQHKRWARVTMTWTATETSGRIRVILTDTVNTRARVWLTAPMIEASPTPTPYTPVGSPRSASRVQIPSANLSPTSGWIAFRVRIPWGNATEPTTDSGVRRVWFWGDANESFSLYYEESDNKFKARKTKAGAMVAQADVPYGLTDGRSANEVTLIVKWTSGNISLSVDGAPFVTGTGPGIPTVAGFTTFDLGRTSVSAANYLYGSFLWAAWGAGTLTDADSVKVHRRFGFGDGLKPEPHDLHFPAAALVANVWQPFASAPVVGSPATTSPYLVNDDGYLGSGFIDSSGETWPDAGYNAVATVHAEDGMQLLAETSVPAADPEDAGEHGDVLAVDEPDFMYPLNDPAGNKAKHFLRKVRANHAGGAVGLYIVKQHRKKMVTRSAAEGSAGPAGTYVNTPQLGQPSLVAGQADPSVRFRRAQSESVIIEAESANDLDFALGTGQITVEAIVCPDSLATGGGNQNTIVSGPATNWSSTLPTFSLWLASGVFAANFFDVGGFNPTLSGGTPAVGDIVHLAVTLVSSGTGILYVDGVAIDTQTLPGFSSPQSPYRIRIGGDMNSAHYFDGRIAYVAIYGSALSAERIAAHADSALNLGYASAFPATRIGAILDELDLWDSAERELQTGLRQLQPVRKAGQDALSSIQQAEDADSGRFLFSPANRPKYLGGGWRRRGTLYVPTLAFGDASTVWGEPDIHVEGDPNVLPYREAAVSKSRTNLIREAKITRVGSEKTQIVTSSFYSPGQIKPSISKEVIVTTDAEALEIATDLVSEFEQARQRAEPLEIVGRDADANGVGETWEAFFLDVGDRVSLVRHPQGVGASSPPPTKTFASQVEHVSIRLNRDRDDSVSLTLSPA